MKCFFINVPYLPLYYQRNNTQLIDKMTNTGYIYGYDLCYPTPLDPNMVVFKVGRSEINVGPFQRLLSEFCETRGPSKEWVEKNSAEILVCRVDLKNSEAETRLFKKLCEEHGAKRWGCFNDKKELFTHTSLEKIKEAMDELISEFGGEWLNYWELQEQHYLVYKLWDNISQFKNWVVSPGGSLEAKRAENRANKAEGKEKNTTPLLRAEEVLKIKTVDQLVKLVKAGKVGKGGTGAKKSTKADIAYIFHQGLIKFNNPKK